MSGASAVIPSRGAAAPKALDVNPVTIVTFLGVTERGPLLAEVTSLDEYKRIFGGNSANSADMDLSMRCFYAEGGSVCHVGRVTHCTDSSDPLTSTAAKGTLDLATAVPSATQGSVISAAGPWALANGYTLGVAPDGGATQTFTLVATAAALESASAGSGFVLANGQTLTIKIDGVALPPKTFSSSEFPNILLVTPAQMRDVLNAFFAANTAGAVASVTNTDRVTITSNRLGSGSIVQVTGGTANTGLGFSTTAVTTVGNNVSNVLAVTAAEWVTIMAGLTGGVASVSSSKLLLTSATTGLSSSMQVVAASTADVLMGFDNAPHGGLAAVAQGTLRADGKTPGAYTDALSLRTAAASNGKSMCFNLYVLRGGIAVERFIDVSMDSTATNYVVNVVNSGYGTQLASNLIEVTDLDSTVPSPGNIPIAGTFGPMTGGDDGLVGLVDADYTGGQSANGSVGLRLFDEIQAIDVLCVPGRATSAVQNGAVTYAETTRKGRTFVLLDPPAGLTCAQMRTYVSSTASLEELSEIASIYYPRILVDNPNVALFGNAATVVAPVSGAIAGLCARLDISKPGGAAEHPASIEIGTLRSARGIETTSDVKDETKRGLLFDTMVNPIMVGNGVYVDGARCLKSTGTFPTVGESRFIIFLQNAYITLVDPKRNRNIRPRLRNEIKMAYEQFLERLTKAECFASNVDAEAWRFDIGTALNTAADAKARRTNSRVGVATSKPSEFFYVEFSPLD